MTRADERTDHHHLGPAELGAFLDGALSGAERARVEDHLADCEACRQEAIEVRRLTAEEEGRGRRGTRWAYWFAPAAVAAVAAILLFGPGSEPTTRSQGPVLRGDDVGAAAIETLSPAGASSSRDSLVFAWHRVATDVVYQVTLLDEEGSVLWKETVEDTSVAPPPDVEIEPGGRYYWYVDGLLEQARTATSGIQEFTLSR